MSTETWVNSPKSVTIEYARLKLGKKGKDMTDKQIGDLLTALRLLCNKTIDSVIKQDHLAQN